MNENEETPTSRFIRLTVLIKALMEGQDVVVTDKDLYILGAAVSEVVKDLGYKVSAEGICAGFSMVALEEFLSAEDLESFKKQFNAKIISICYAYAQPGQDAIFELNEKEEYANFFKCIEFFQNTSNQRDVENISKQVGYKKIKEMGGLKKVNSLISIYTPEELLSYVQMLDKLAKSSGTNLAFKLSASFQGELNHAITICYDVKKDAWIIINSMKALVQEFSSLAEFSKGIGCAYMPPHGEGTLAFETVLLTVGENTEKVNQFMNALENSEDFKKLNNIDEKKAAQVSHSGQSLVHLAITLGDDEVLEQLSQKGADLDKVDKRGLRPVYLALTSGNLKALGILVQHGADFTQGWKSTISGFGEGYYKNPYAWAIFYNKSEVTKFFDNLFASALNQYIENNFNFNKSPFFAASPAYTAVKKMLHILQSDPKKSIEFSDEEREALSIDPELEKIIAIHEGCFNYIEKNYMKTNGYDLNVYAEEKIFHSEEEIGEHIDQMLKMASEDLYQNSILMRVKLKEESGSYHLYYLWTISVDGKPQVTPLDCDLVDDNITFVSGGSHGMHVSIAEHKGLYLKIKEESAKTAEVLETKSPQPK